MKQRLKPHGNAEMWYLTIFLSLFIASYATTCQSPPPNHNNGLEEVLLSRMNFSVDPCNDFFTYACGNAESYVNSIAKKVARVLKNDLDKLISSGREYPHTSAYGKALRMYKACVNENVSKAEVDAHTKTNVNAFLEKFNFPIDFFFNDNTEVKIDRERFSEILKYVHDNFFIEPFFNVESQSTKLYPIDKPKGFTVWTFFTVKKSFETTVYECNSPKLLEKFIEGVRNVTKAMGLTATDCKIQKTAQDLMDFELRLNGIPCGNNNVTIKIEGHSAEMEKLTFENVGIDINNYARSLIATGRGNSNFNVLFTLMSLREVLESTSDADLLRYIYFRIVSKNAVEVDCDKTLTSMALVKSRIYTDFKYASPEEREYFSDGMKFADVIGSVKKNVEDMVLSMPWIQDDKHAYETLVKKFQNLRAEVAIEKDLLNDTWLDNYYDQIQFNDNDRFFNMYSKAQKFVMYEKVRLTVRDQTDYDGDTTSATAQYIRHLNKFIINDGYLNAPNYDKSYDFSFNFGSIAGTAGHEISHSVDSGGMVHDENGFMKPFLNNATKMELEKMENCVIDQFNKIQVLPGNYTPNHVNGKQTLGENMADISGFEAASRSFEIMKRDGKLAKRPQFTHPKLRELTHDQLFFLGVVNLFCIKQDYNIRYLALAIDDHAPNMARAQSLSNIPAFGKAFNCPLDSKYRPNEYCKVWTH